MSVEDLYVELARHKAEIAKLTGRVEAVENVVYNRQAEKTQQLLVQEVLKDLDVSLRDRLEIVDENEVRAREYFHDKDDWSTINKVMKQHGFKWVSQGKESCWRRQ